MGIVVETSFESRPRAAASAGAVNDDTGQDNGHAGDAEQVRNVLARDHVVRELGRRHPVYEHVHHPSRGHQRQAEEDQRRERS
jgi:hypothetical protein